MERVVQQTVAPVRIDSGWGDTPSVRSAVKNYGRPPQLFGSTSTISRFGERFRAGQ